MRRNFILGDWEMIKRSDSDDEYKPVFLANGLEYKAENDFFYYPPVEKPALLKSSRKMEVKGMKKVVMKKLIKVEENDEKKKARRKSLGKDSLFEWDVTHRRANNNHFVRGSIIVRCCDVNSPEFGEVIWMVDSYQLLQRYVFEKDDPKHGKVFNKTARFAGWLCDEPWSYFQLKNVSLVDKQKNRLGVAAFPTKHQIQNYRERIIQQTPFYNELLSKLKKVKTEEEDELEEGEIIEFKQEIQ